MNCIGKTGYQKFVCEAGPLGMVGQDGFNIIVIKTAAGASLRGRRRSSYLGEWRQSATIIEIYSISA